MNPPRNPVQEARDTVCQRLLCNLYGRVDVIIRLAETGNDTAARSELIALLRFFPRQRKKSVKK